MKTAYQQNDINLHVELSPNQTGTLMFKDIGFWKRLHLLFKGKWMINVEFDKAVQSTNLLA